MTIMMMMMMIMTDPFTTNLVVKGPVAKGAVVKGAHPIIIAITIIMTHRPLRGRPHHGLCLLLSISLRMKRTF